MQPVKSSPILKQAARIDPLTAVTFFLSGTLMVSGLLLGIRWDLWDPFLNTVCIEELQSACGQVAVPRAELLVFSLLSVGGIAAVTGIVLQVIRGGRLPRA